MLWYLLFPLRGYVLEDLSPNRRVVPTGGLVFC